MSQISTELAALEAAGQKAAASALANVESRVEALEAKADTVITTVVAKVKQYAPVIARIVAVAAAGYGIAKLDVVSFVLKHLG